MGWCIREQRTDDMGIVEDPHNYVLCKGKKMGVGAEMESLRSCAFDGSSMVRYRTAELQGADADREVAVSGSPD